MTASDFRFTISYDSDSDEYDVDLFSSGFARFFDILGVIFFSASVSERADSTSDISGSPLGAIRFNFAGRTRSVLSGDLSDVSTYYAPGNGDVNRSATIWRDAFSSDDIPDGATHVVAYCCNNSALQHTASMAIPFPQPVVPPVPDTPVTPLVIVEDEEMRSLNMYDADIRYADVGRALLTPGTTGTALTANPSVVSDGMVYDSVGQIQSRGSIAVGDGEGRAVGVHMTGPDVTGSRTLYRIVGEAFCPNSSIVPMIGFGIGTASPSGSVAAGQASTRPEFIRSGIGGRALIDELIGLVPFGTISGTDFSGRSVVVFAYFFNPTSADITAVCVSSLSVQRLVGPPPQYYDRRIG